MQLNLFSPAEKYKLISLASGSNGNCYFIGTASRGILVDAGIGVASIKKHLREHGISYQNIMAVLITHDHADHIRSVGSLGEKLKLPIYATQAVHDAIGRSFFVRDGLRASARFVKKEETIVIHDFEVTPFEVPHDSFDNVGYHIRFGEHSITLATDVGRITDRIEHYARMAQTLIFESNYDETMLQTGRYPQHLKQRIACGTGHLSNRQAADFLAKIYSPRLKTIWLCHLSGDNNRPELAYNQTADALSKIGVEVGKHIQLQTLNRGKPSKAQDFIVEGRLNLAANR